MTTLQTYIHNKRSIVSANIRKQINSFVSALWQPQRHRRQPEMMLNILRVYVAYTIHLNTHTHYCNFMLRTV